MRVYDLDPFPAELREQPSEVMTADIADGDALREAMKDCEIVYHLAGNPQLWAPELGLFDRVNHRGTENVLFAAESVGIRRLVYTSTESILASRDHNGPISEETITRLI